MTVNCKRFGSSTQIIIPNFRYLSVLAPSPGNAKLVCHFCEKRLSWDFSFLHLVWLESESSKVTNKYISDYHRHHYYSWSNSSFLKPSQKLQFHTVWMRIMAEEVAKMGSRFIQIRLFKLDCYSINSSPPCGVEGSVIGNHQMAGYRWCYTFYLQLALEEVLIVSCGAVLLPHENTIAKTLPEPIRQAKHFWMWGCFEKDFSKGLPWESTENPVRVDDPPVSSSLNFYLLPAGYILCYAGPGHGRWGRAIQKQKEKNTATLARWQSISALLSHPILLPPPLCNRCCPLRKSVNLCCAIGEEAGRLHKSRGMLTLVTYRMDIWIR